VFACPINDILVKIYPIRRMSLFFCLPSGADHTTPYRVDNKHHDDFGTAKRVMDCYFSLNPKLRLCANVTGHSGSPSLPIY
jgi:hypothetical protein